MSQCPIRPIIQKHQHLRAPKLLAQANGAPCMNCGAEDGTVVAAHSNNVSDGKGRGIKADDAKIAFLCHECHSWYDSSTDEDDPTGCYPSSAAQKRLMFLNALAETYLWLLKNGKLKVS